MAQSVLALASVSWQSSVADDFAAALQRFYARLPGPGTMWTSHGS